MKRVLVYAISILIGAVGAVGVASIDVSANPDIVCPDGGEWTKQESGFNFSADEGKIVTEVCVKGGQDRVFFTENGNDGCWEVDGIGTDTAVVTKIGQGPVCKDISHASFKQGDEPKIPDDEQNGNGDTEDNGTGGRQTEDHQEVNNVVNESHPTILPSVGAKGSR